MKIIPSIPSHLPPKHNNEVNFRMWEVALDQRNGNVMALTVSNKMAQHFIMNLSLESISRHFEVIKLHHRLVRHKEIGCGVVTYC